MTSKKGECCVCQVTDKLTIHHVLGGKRKERQANPLQQKWLKQHKKTVTLCLTCHKLVHRPRVAHRLLQPIIKRR